MDTILLVQLAGNTWERLDIFEDIPITLTIQQNDLTNLTSRRVPYSRTITLPGTNNNDILFEHYFEVNGLDFNPLQKIPCVVQYRGTDIFQGILRLNSVTTNTEERTYEIFILGEVSDFLAPLRNLQLQDLDYTDLNHILDYSAVTTSWECVNDGASGLFNGQILYPLINYGLDYQGATSGGTPTFSYDFGTATSFDTTSNPVASSMFKPAIQLKSILDRMFATTGYEVVSNFLNSEYFTAIYTDTFQNGKLGVEYASGVTNQNIFKANGQQVVFDYNNNIRHIIPWFDDRGDAYDPLNNFFNEGGTNNGPFFRAPYAGQYGWNIAFNIKGGAGLFSPLFPAKVVVEAWKTTDINSLGTLFFSSAEINLNPTIFGDALSVNLFFDEVLAPGEIIQIRILDKTINIPALISFPPQRNYTISRFDDGTISRPFYFWDLYQSPTIISDLVDMRLGIPNIECIQFLKSIITMFNLVIKQDETTRRVLIEPYNSEYNDTTRTPRDWTNILDLNSDIKVEPLSYELSKDLVFTYEYTDFEYLPREFYGRFDYVFGRQRFTSTSNLFTGEQIYEIPFGSCPTSGVTNAPNFIIPQFYYLNNNQQAPYATKPHLFFWVGNRLAYTDALRTQQGSWYLLSGSTPVEWTTYPCVSHLSTLESKIPEVISDLNFQSTFDFFGNSTNQIQQFTEFTLYNSFWRTYIENLYDPTGKRLTGNFYFRPIDVYETQLNDKIWIKDSWFTIEKITDADLVNKRLTQISLIKDNIPYYQIDPPAPIYIYSPNQGYPTPEPFYYDLAYISTDKDSVCNGTATLQTFYSFGSGTLGNLDQVYLDIGTAYVLLPQGTYIRQISTTTTFVCVDNYGRILETTC
jgi:hypothetical protein